MSTALSRKMRLGTVAVLVLAALSGPVLAQGNRNRTPTPEQIDCPDLPSGRSLRNPDWDAATFELPRQIIARAKADTLNFDAGLVSSAMSQCRGSVINGSRLRVEGYACEGDAALLLAQRSESSRDDNFKRAFCAFSAVAVLAPGNGERDRQRRAEALYARGQALEGRYGVGRNTEFLNRAIESYRTGLGIAGQGSNLNLRRGLASALATSGRDTEADTAYTDLLALPGIVGNERASILVAHARLKERIGRPPADLLPLWRGAQQALNPQARAEINVELGRLLVRTDPNSAEARTLFAQAVGLPIENVNGVNYRSEANYQLSVMEGRLRNWPQAYDSANAAGNSEFRYRRQLCLAFVARGQRQWFTGADAASTCRGDETAEGQLLRGMYFLTRAQYVQNITVPANRRVWDGYIDQATSAFSTSRDLARSLTGDAARLNWPGNNGAPAILETAEFGLSLVGVVGRACPVGSAPIGTAAARSVFETYNVLGSNPCLR